MVDDVIRFTHTEQLIHLIFNVFFCENDNSKSEPEFYLELETRTFWASHTFLSSTC